MIQRPAAVTGLMRAQVDRDLGLQRLVYLVQEMHHHDVFRWNGAVGLEFEYPVAGSALQGDQRLTRGRDGTLE